MTKQQRQRLEELRKMLHVFYQNPLQHEREIDQIAREIKQLQEAEYEHR